MEETDIVYYKRRLEEEESRAASIDCPATKCAHLKMARLYREQIERQERASQPHGPVRDVERIGRL